MSKVLKVLFSILMLIVLCPLAPVNAEETIEYYVDDITDIEAVEGANRSYTYYSKADNKTYQVNSYDDYTEIVDPTTNVVLASATVNRGEKHYIDDENNISMMRVSPDDYEKWFDFTLVYTDDLYINPGVATSVSIIIQLICDAFGLSPLGTVGSMIVDLATEAYNKKYEHMYADVYWSNNVYCTMLYKQKMRFYADNGIFLDESPVEIKWNGSSNDPNAPYACKILDQRY